MNYDAGVNTYNANHQGYWLKPPPPIARTGRWPKIYWIGMGSKSDGLHTKAEFLHIMRNFEDYSSPFDYYMCNAFEKSLDLKHYWSANQFFIQGSNAGLCPSTLRENI